MLRKQLALASDAGLSVSVSLRQNFAPPVRTLTAGVHHAEYIVSTSAHRQRAAHAVARECSSSSMSRDHNPARSGITHPAELKLWVKQFGTAECAKFIASASSDVNDLKRDIKKKLEIAASIDLLSLLLEVADGDGTAISGKGNGDTAPTKLVPLESRASVFDALKAVLGRDATVHDVLSIFVDVAKDVFLRADATTEEVYDLLGPLARTAVDEARAHRKRLSDNRVLMGLKAVMSSAEATAFGIDVLRTDEEGNFALGTFDVAPIDAKIVTLPKSFDMLQYEPMKMVLTRQRLSEAFELVDAVTLNHPFGVHLSGPRDVGKSAIALLSYLLCAARGLPAVYIPSTLEWIKAANTEREGGDIYFVEAFWRQNADLIITMPALRKVFLAALKDRARPFSREVSPGIGLGLAFDRRNSLRYGAAVVLDEVQHITRTVQAVEERREKSGFASKYFALNWYEWCNRNAVFQRMTAASEHAHRDMRQPDGEAHRVRFILPLDSADRAVLQKAPSSPAYIFDEAARVRAEHICGNVLGKLIVAASLLPRDRKPTEELRLHRTQLFDNMILDCRAWLQSMSAYEHFQFAHAPMDVLTGKMSWVCASHLYDAGIVFRTQESPFVLPVSSLASAVILRVIASSELENMKPLSSIPYGRHRGFELERQFLGRVDGYNHRLLQTKLLDGTSAPHAPHVDVNCSYALPFTSMADLVARDEPVLYRPTSGIFACDGIVMPAADSEAGEILLIECSTRDPLHSHRVAKVRKWFSSVGLVTQILAQFPRRKVRVLLVYDGVLQDRSRTDLNDNIIALSNGAPLLAEADADTASDAFDDAEGEADDWARGSSIAPRRHCSDTQPQLGNVVCVIDAPILTELHLAM